MSDGGMIVEFENVMKKFENGVHALDGLTMSVPPGSVFGFIGLNGAGKTTTIRLLAGLSRKDSGEIRLFGKEIERHNYSYKRDIGFVLDEPLYFDWLSAREYLEFVGTMYDLQPHDIRTRVAELLDFFELLDKEDSTIGSFSTGMKKKVSLAAAIIHNPRLVILDEPLEGIDAVAASSIKEALSMMASKGATVFISSHVLDTIERFCTEIAIIHNGKILLQCHTEDIRSRIKDSLTKSTFESLEELFVELVSDKMRRKHLSWL